MRERESGVGWPSGGSFADALERAKVARGLFRKLVRLSRDSCAELAVL